jgi:hypothetical protein
VLKESRSWSRHCATALDRSRPRRFTNRSIGGHGCSTGEPVPHREVGRSQAEIAPITYALAEASSDGALQFVEELQRLAAHMVGELGLDDALDAASLDVAHGLGLEVEDGLHRAHHCIDLGVL